MKTVTVSRTDNLHVFLDFCIGKGVGVRCTLFDVYKPHEIAPLYYIGLTINAQGNPIIAVSVSLTNVNGVFLNTQGIIADR